ncbi:MAG: ABC transporter ATP-binding protein [Acidimicrobiia bacterium]|nr:ABC transporter ATP-binding protein [Acidimicrobiia bacterium]
MGAESEPLLEVRGLVKHFRQARVLKAGRAGRTVKAVDGIDLTLFRGRTHGLVGESGSGKSTAGLTTLRIHQATSGTALFNGRDLFKLSEEEMREARRELQIIFQNPLASVDPRQPVRWIISEPWLAYGMFDRHERRRRVDELLLQVGLAPEHADRFPSDFSGGQLQRIGIARALALDPALIVCDEPVSALDLSIQAQIINLLAEAQRRRGLSYLFITHDLAVARYFSDTISVMYLGKILEEGTSEEVFEAPAHPYTHVLLSSIPDPDRVGSRRERVTLHGAIPTAANPPSGCVFRTRCWKAESICSSQAPELVDRGQGHPVACHFPG